MSDYWVTVVKTGYFKIEATSAEEAENLVREMDSEGSLWMDLEVIVEKEARHEGTISLAQSLLG